MPNYDFKCKDCKKVVELINYPSLEAAKADANYCPQCDGEGTMELKPSAPAFVVKGGTPKFY